MERILKIYDDADEWLSMAWLASGPRLWFSIVAILTLALTLCFILKLGLVFLVAAVTTALIGLMPAVNNRLFD